MLTIYTTLLTICVLAVFWQAHRQMTKPVFPAAKPMHIITASTEALYFTPVYTIPLDDEWQAAIDNKKENSVTNTPWPMTATDTTTCNHRPWSGWSVELDGDYPLGFVALCEACETNIVRQENGWTEHGTNPSAHNLDMLHAEKRNDWYDPENANGFWAED